MSRCVELRRARPLLGTFVDLTARGADEKTLQRGIAAAFRAIARVHELMSVHDPASELSRLNRAGHLREVRLHRWTFRVLRAAQKFSERSGGVFDATIAPANWRNVILNSRQRSAHFTQPLALDLGGIAKGFAVDRAVEAMRRAGVPSGVVNAGGDLRVFGNQPEVIRIRDCDGAISLRDAALATSAKSSRTVSVVATTCMTADALTKIVVALGEDAAPLLKEFSAQAAIIAEINFPTTHAA